MAQHPPGVSICISSSMGSNMLLGPPRTPTCICVVHRHTFLQPLDCLIFFKLGQIIERFEEFHLLK